MGKKSNFDERAKKSEFPVPVMPGLTRMPYLCGDLFKRVRTYKQKVFSRECMHLHHRLKTFAEIERERVLKTGHGSVRPV